VENKQTELKSHSKIIPWKYTALIVYTSYLSRVLGIFSITLSFENTQPHVRWIRVGSVLVCCHILLILHAQWENGHLTDKILKSTCLMGRIPILIYLDK
jgi:hypothetical protein